MKISDTERRVSGRPVSTPTSGDGVSTPSRDGVDGQARSFGRDLVSIRGIPEQELTPAVQSALQSLMAEVSELRRDLDATRSRLRDAEGLADRDTLVPLYNRRAFVREVTRAVSAGKRYGHSLGLLYLDLDGLKAINDTHGHAAGDAALQGIAALLLAEVRDSDIIARLGGDEFGVLLEHITAAEAVSKAHQIRRRLAETPVQYGAVQFFLSASIGAIGLHPDEDAEQALKRADEKMYQVKRAKR